MQNPPIASLDERLTAGVLHIGRQQDRTKILEMKRELSPPIRPFLQHSAS